MEKHADKGRGVVYIASRIFLDSGRAVVPGAVAVVDGAVVAAGRPREVERSLPGGFARREFPGAAILPGFVNAHTHLQIPRMTIPEAGEASQDSSFVEWILSVIAWRINAPRNEFRKNFEAAAAEAVSSGTTAVGEISRPDSGLYGDSPLRARVFAEGIGFNPGAAKESFSLAESDLARLEECARESCGLVAAGLSPHTLYTVGPGLLGLLGELAVRKGIPVCLHLAESPAEMEFLSTGGGPVATRLYPAVGRDVSWFRGIGMSIPSYLKNAGLLREGLLLVHNVHLSREDIGILRRGGARFVLCPRSNAAHGNGLPDVAHFVDTGIPFALGTDSLGSVPDLSLWDEMRAARSVYLGKLQDADLCRVLLQAVTENGAAALRLAGGSLRPEGPADFIAVDDPGGDRDSAARNLVERTNVKNVQLTVVGGNIRYKRG